MKGKIAKKIVAYALSAWLFLAPAANTIKAYADSISPLIKNVFVVSKTEKDNIASTKPKYPVEGEKTDLFAVIEADVNGSKMYFSNSEKIALNESNIDSQKIKKWNDNEYGKLDLRWGKMISEKSNYTNGNKSCYTYNGKEISNDLICLIYAAENSESASDKETAFKKIKEEIKNISGKDINSLEELTQNIKAKELGWQWDKVEYVENPSGNGWQCIAENVPGTLRYKVTVRQGNKEFSSPGNESINERRIDNIHRISVRGKDNNNYISWLRSFYNLPFIWASASLKDQLPSSEHQTEHYVGADCADLVVGAWRASGHKEVPYYCSGGFRKGDLYSKYTKYIIDQASPGKEGLFYNSKNEPIMFGKEGVQVGDVVYFGGHVGVLSKDNSPEGFLDENDLHIHTLFDRVAEEPLSKRFSSEFSVLRWKDGKK